MVLRDLRRRTAHPRLTAPDTHPIGQPLMMNWRWRLMGGATDDQETILNIEKVVIDRLVRDRDIGRL